MFDKYQKASRACPDKKEREEIEMLKTQVRFQDFKDISLIRHEIGQFMKYGGYCICIKSSCNLGVHWLSGRVLDSRPRGRGFEPHRLHCVVPLSKTH